MEDWRVGGMQSPHDVTQARAALGLVAQASTAIRDSRTQLDRLHGRLSELLMSGRTFPRTEPSESHAVGELWAELKALGTEADAVLNNVATRIVEAAEALSGASSAARQTLGQATPRPQTTLPSPARGPAAAHSSSATATPDEITRRDDVRYRY